MEINVIDLICKICGKKFQRNRANIRAGCCSRVCGAKHRTERWKKLGHPLKGRIFKPETIQKMREVKLGKKMSQECCMKHRISSSGLKNGHWKGGRRIDKDGYVLVWQPEHPFCDSLGYIREHRLIVEKAIGRFLKETEKVHHVHGDKSNNGRSNLVACQDEAYHQLLHFRTRQLGMERDGVIPALMLTVQGRPSIQD